MSSQNKYPIDDQTERPDETFSNTEVNENRTAVTRDVPRRLRGNRSRQRSEEMSDTDNYMTMADGATAPAESGEAATSTEMLAKSDRFENLGRIGVGGMGAVHLVNDLVLLRKVAMKSLHPKLARKHEHAERFLREVQVTGRLDHPNIVPVHDIGFHSEGNAFFVMKHIDGQTLTERIADVRDQPLVGSVLEELLQIFLKLTNAIGFAHSRGVIHRDLKPANIMVGSHGEVYVMDWGIAMLCADAEPPTNDGDPLLEQERLRRQHEYDGSLLGTVGYMSPEQAEGRVNDIDFRSDVFGLGAILYEILTGRAPYAGGRAVDILKRARKGEVRPPQDVSRRHLPPGLCSIAMKAMAFDPADRYQSVSQLERAITAFLRGGGWFETRTVPAGTIIVQEGDEADSAYIIESGHCQVYKTVNGERQELRELGPGDVFGETAIFTGKERTASVASKDEVKVIVITSESLDYELSEKRWLAAFVRTLAERFCDVDNQLSAINAAASKEES